MRTDIPEDLRRSAAAVSPGLLAWLEAGYPTKREQRRREAKRRRRALVQLKLPIERKP